MFSTSRSKENNIIINLAVDDTATSVQHASPKITPVD
jgi:hypothetical protein